MVKLVLN